MSTSNTRQRSLRTWLGYPVTVLCLACFVATGQAGNLDKDLRNAARKGKLEKIEELLSRGANPNSVDSDGRTALMFAAKEGHKDVVRLLLANGADHTMRSANGLTALMFAEKENNPLTGRLLQFEVIKSRDSLEGYREFARKYSYDEIGKEAQRRLARLEYDNLVKEDDLYRYEHFLEFHPRHLYADSITHRIAAKTEDKRLAEYARANASDSLKVIRAFLNDWKNTQLDSVWQERIEELEELDRLLEWACPTLYTEFIEKHPNHRLAASFRDSIDLYTSQDISKPLFISYNDFVVMYGAKLKNLRPGKGIMSLSDEVVAGWTDDGGYSMKGSFASGDVEIHGEFVRYDNGIEIKPGSVFVTRKK